MSASPREHAVAVEHDHPCDDVPGQRLPIKDYNKEFRVNLQQLYLTHTLAYPIQ